MGLSDCQYHFGLYLKFLVLGIRAPLILEIILRPLQYLYCLPLGKYMAPKANQNLLPGQFQPGRYDVGTS